MSDHATLSPSKRMRWSKCPGSVREEAKYPDTSGAGAIDGTHSHTLLETCVKAIIASTDNGSDPFDYIGQTLTDHEGEFKVDKARATRVMYAIHYINERRDELGSNVVIASERKVDPIALTGRSDLKGTCDIQIGHLASGTLEIADYKDGMNLVEPDSEQLRQYAVAAMSELNESNRQRIKTLRLTVIQPKVADKGLQPIRFKDFDAQEFLASELPKLIAEAATTDDPNAPLIPSKPGEPDHCKYCKHKGACAALTDQMMETAGITFANLDVAKEAAGKQPTELSDEQIKELVEAAPVLRSMLEGVEAEALRRMEGGHAIPGLKVVRGRGSRTWAFDEPEMAEKLKKFGIPKDVLWETKLVSPAKAEKLKWKKRDGSEKQLSERQLKTLTEEYIKKSDGKLTVASDSDPRPAVTMNVASMFGAVSAEPSIPDWLK